MASYAALAAEKAGLGIGGGGTDVFTDGQADIHLAEAYKDLVSKVATADPNLLDLFMKKIDSGWSNNTYALENHFIFSVFRKGTAAPANVYRECRKIMLDRSQLASVSGSIYEATEMSPVYWVENQKLNVLPDHTVNSGEFMYYGVVAPDSIDADDTYPATPMTDGEILMPHDFAMSLVIYLAMRLVERKLVTMNDALATMIDEDDAPIAPTLSGEGSPKGGWEVVRYYVHDEEDPELSGAKIQELGAEQQQWAMEYQWYQDRYQKLKSEYLEPFASLMASTNAEAPDAGKK